MESHADQLDFGLPTEAFGQSESLTRRLRHILELYPEGPSILSELIQVTRLTTGEQGVPACGCSGHRLDHRRLLACCCRMRTMRAPRRCGSCTTPGATARRPCWGRRWPSGRWVPCQTQWTGARRSQVLTDDSLCCVRLQGPALYLFNDATFSKEDFANIARIGQASKLDKVGRNASIVNPKEIRVTDGLEPVLCRLLRACRSCRRAASAWASTARTTPPTCPCSCRVTTWSSSTPTPSTSQAPPRSSQVRHLSEPALPIR